MYRSAIQEHKTFDLPNIASLLVGVNSRIVVGFSENQDQGHELNVSTSPMAVNENDDSSVVTNECVLPVEVDLEPVLAKNCTRSNQTWYIKYGERLCEQTNVHDRHEFEAPRLLLQSATVNTFANNKYVMIVSERYAMSVVNSGNSEFYVFDLHARTVEGLPDDFGTAVVMKIFGVLELQHYLCKLLDQLNIECFEIVPVQFMRACFDFDNQACATFKDRVTVDSRPFPSVVNRTSFEQGPLCDISVATLKVSSMCSFSCSARERARRLDHKSVERDREPSRLPYNRILSVLQNKKIRKRTKRMIKTGVPKSSFMYQLATNHNTYMNMLLKRKLLFQ